MELLTKLGINWQTLVAQIVNFTVVLGVLTWAVYKPLLNLLDARTERVRKAMDDARRVEEETKALDRQRIERLKLVDEEASKLLADARVRAEGIHREVLDKARVDAEQLIEKGRQVLASERAAALKDVQDALSSVIVQLTEKLLQREFSAADQKKFLGDMQQSIPSMLK